MNTVINTKNYIHFHAYFWYYSYFSLLVYTSRTSLCLDWINITLCKNAKHNLTLEHTQPIQSSRTRH